jgi:quercetin dioxygenase-like cupin family protein
MAPPLTGKSLIRTKEAIMTITLVALILLSLMTTGTAMAQQAKAPRDKTPQAKVTSLMSKDLPEAPGKEALMIAVEYPPGSSDPIHRHNAHAMVYVLEGSIVMQVKGGKEVTLTPGQTFYEGPDDVHVVGRNASKTKPAKFVVVLIKEKGAPVQVPVE